MNKPSRLIPLIAILLSLMLFPLASSAASLEDWTLDDVLSQVLHANGGKEAIMSITNVRIRGQVQGSEETYDFMLLKKRPDKMRIRLTMKGRAIETGFNGVTGWRRLSQGNEQKVIDVTGDDLLEMKLDSDFDGPLVGPSAEGVERRLAGVERIDRVDYFIVEVSKPNSVNLHYVDSRTFREMKVIQKRTLASGEEVETIISYFDYKRHGGIWVAMRSERSLPGGLKETVLVNGVDINPAVLDRSFDRPED